MNTISANLQTLKLDAITNKQLPSLLTKLQQTGAFKAIVIESSGQRVVLDTLFGKLNAGSVKGLNKGDILQATLLGDSLKNPILKVTQQQAKSLVVPQRFFSGILSTSVSSPVLAKVLAHTKTETMLQVADKTFSIPRQASLKVGDTVSINRSTQSFVELTPNQNQQTLKNALLKLLPSTVQASSSQSSKLPSPKEQSLETLQKLISIVNTQSNDKPLTNHQHSRAQHLLKVLAQPLAQVETIRPGTIKSLLTFFSLLKPEVVPMHQVSEQNLPSTIKGLLAEIKTSPDKFDQFIRLLMVAKNTNQMQSAKEPASLEMASNFRQELVSQLEHTITQLLVQKTSVRLQVEQNQPIQFNLNIPVQVNDKTTSLKLKIKEKSKKEDPKEQQWEINLSFEFGLLGLVSTHLLLQDIKLSAHFWAESKATKQLIDSELDSFKEQLQKAGFEPGMFNCSMGSPKTKNDNSHLISENLIDIKV